MLQTPTRQPYRSMFQPLVVQPLLPLLPLQAQPLLRLPAPLMTPVPTSQPAASNAPRDRSPAEPEPEPEVAVPEPEPDVAVVPEPEPEPEPGPESPAGGSGGLFGRAIHDCAGEDSDELTFKTGDLIEVTVQPDPPDGWWTGRLGDRVEGGSDSLVVTGREQNCPWILPKGVTGIFPSSFVTLLQAGVPASLLHIAE
jgi:hypothetical protein